LSDDGSVSDRVRLDRVNVNASFQFAEGCMKPIREDVSHIVMFVAVAAVLIAVASTPVSADNNAIGGAQNITAGGPALDVHLDVSAPSRFYIFTAFEGRSYCAETAPGQSETAVVVDTEISILHANHVLIVANDDTAEEPRTGLNAGGFGLSRACWVAGATEATYVQVNTVNGDTETVRLRVIETTLFSNFFYLSGDYSAFTIVRNTTSSLVHFNITWRDATGTPAAALSGQTLAANGSTMLDARNQPAALQAVSGSVEIATDSSPDAIVAITTVLSATSGLAIDAPFTRRQPW
jgi:hypothetical protein